MQLQINYKCKQWIGIPLLLLAYLILCPFISACLSSDSVKETTPSKGGICIIGDQGVQTAIHENLKGYISTILDKYNPKKDYHESIIIYPYNESVFPLDIAAPTFEWVEKEAGIRSWLINITFGNRINPLNIFCSKPIWTPDRGTWELIKQNSTKGSALITILGVNSQPKSEIVSKSIVSIYTSLDIVEAPIIFRRVPPSFAFAAKNPETMSWCLADISSYEEPPVIMSNQPVCGSCHTFSQDGKSIGMDMDYKKDKGAYFFADVSENIDLKDEDFISWNDIPRTEDDGLQSSGLLSRISPDGEYIASTVNEIFFLIMLGDPYVSQLFFPLQGSLAYYAKSDGEIHSLAGADLSDVIQTDPCWSPDGKNILFSRATLERDYFKELGGKTIFSVEDGDIDQLNKQYPVQFDIYSIPFNEGQGGKAVPLAGASHNGKSNYFPRYSPDGKWVVFTQSTTGIAIQPDSKLFIMPATGDEPRLMNSNLTNMNSWHTWSPNGKWLAFVSKENTAFTELFLTHIDENGNDSPPILLSRFNKAGYAVNLPEFANIPPSGIQKITLNGN